MTQPAKAKVFINRRNQAVQSVAAFHFPRNAVYIHRDATSGDLILSQCPASFADIVATLQKLEIPEDFLCAAERAPAQEITPQRFGL